jgi:hypothetical protein
MVVRRRLRDLLNLAGFDAGCADTQAFAGPIDQRADILKIQIPAALRDIVGMADPVPELRPSAADFANLCHNLQF